MPSFGFPTPPLQPPHQPPSHPLRDKKKANKMIKKEGNTSPFNKTEFSYLLGSTDPCPNAVHMEPFSTSVFKVPI